MEIIVNERYAEAGSGDPDTLQIDLFNPGTLKILEVRMDVATPLGWECEMVPQALAALLPGARESVRVTAASSRWA